MATELSSECRVRRCRSTFRCRRPLRRGGRRDETSVDLSEFQTRFAPVVVVQTEVPASTEAWRGRANDTRTRDNASSRAVADRAHPPPAVSELATHTGINTITSVNKQVLPSNVRKRSAAKTPRGYVTLCVMSVIPEDCKHCQEYIIVLLLSRTSRRFLMSLDDKTAVDCSLVTTTRLSKYPIRHTCRTLPFLNCITTVPRFSIEHSAVTSSRVPSRVDPVLVNNGSICNLKS